MEKGRKIVLLTLTAIAFAFALPLCFIGEARAQTQVTVDLTARRQIIHGFGGMDITWNPNGLLSSANRQLVFGNGPNQLGFTVLRVYLGENQTEWSRTVDNAKWASDNGVLVFASPWHPPQSMRQTRDTTINGQRRTYYRLNPSSYTAYTNHINAYIEYMYSNGVNLYAVSIQNEPDYGINNYSDDGWCLWNQQEMVNFMRDHAGNIDPRVKVISPETFQYEAWSGSNGQAKPLFTAMLNDAGARRNIDIFGTHFYGVHRPSLSDPSLPFQWSSFEAIGRPEGKELWMTEVYTPDNRDGNIWNADSASDAMRTARIIHYSKVAGGMSTWVWWYIHRFYSVLHDGLGHPNTTPQGTNGQITKRGWITAQYSKFIRPGFHRVETTPSRFGSNDDNRTFISAYHGDNGTVVIVAVNMNSAAQSVNFSISGATSGLSTMEVWRTSGTENLAKQTNINVSGNAFSANLPGRSVTTFTGTASTTTAVLYGNGSAAGASVPMLTVRGRTLTVNALDDSELNIRIVNLTGRTVASFSANGRSNVSLRKLPAGSYIMEAKQVKSGAKMVSNIVLR